jgi:superfamily II DNA or RNA helicase
VVDHPHRQKDSHESDDQRIVSGSRALGYMHRTGHVSAMNLRPYQLDCLDRSKAALDRGCNRQLAVLATGLGKAVLFAALREHHGFRKRIMVLVHREELADQGADKLARWNPGLMCGVEMAHRNAAPMDSLVVASVPTLGRRNSERIKKFDPADFDCIVSDEAHHSTSPQWKRVLDHFGLLSAGSRILSLGLTATPNRSDGTGLRDCFDEIVFNMDIKAGIDTGYLSDLIGYRVSTKTNLDSVHTRMGDFAEEELADAVNTPERNAIIVKEWCKHAYGKKTVAFTVNVQHALDLGEAFKSHVISAAAVYGEDPDRATKLARHRAGEIQVLCNCQVLTEGYDDPEIECIILAKPTKSQLLFTQMIGRGARIPDGVDNIKTHVGPLSKDSCIILDVVDSTSKHNLITMPSLMGLPKSLDMKGERYTKAREQLERVAAEFPTANIQDIHNLSELDSIAKNIELFRASYPPEVSKLTELAWRKQGDTYALPVGRDRIVIAADLLGDWWVRGMVSGKPVEIQAQNLAGAFNAADRAVLDSGAPKVLLARESRWRNEGPSDKQVQLCRKLRIPIPIGATRGMVSAALDTHFGGRA